MHKIVHCKFCNIISLNILIHNLLLVKAQSKKFTTLCCFLTNYFSFSNFYTSFSFFHVRISIEVKNFPFLLIFFVHNAII